MCDCIHLSHSPVSTWEMQGNCAQGDLPMPQRKSEAGLYIQEVFCSVSLKYLEKDP